MRNFLFFLFVWLFTSCNQPVTDQKDYSFLDEEIAQLTTDEQLQAYWEDIPDCIVVGIEQASTRKDDFFFDNETYFPAHEGADFFEFITMELIPYIEDNYHVSDFRIAIGHDLSANFMNYYLFKNPPLFRAYIALSPDLAPEMVNRLSQRIPSIEKETFYYLATADADESNTPDSP